MLRFRTSLIVGALAATILLLATLVMRPVALQIREAKALVRLGARPSRIETAPVARTWFDDLRVLTRSKPFQHAVSFRDNHFEFYPSELHALEDLPFLKTIAVAGGPVSAEREATFEHLVQLDTLQFRRTLAGSGSRLRIRNCPKLRELLLDNVDFEDIELASLVGLPAITLINDRVAAGRRSLAIVDVPKLLKLNITRDARPIESGVFRLTGAPGLQTLDIREVPLRSVEVIDLPNLRTLEIRTTNFDDDGAAELRGLKRLRVLRLVVCKLTDRGLARLPDLPSLKVLDLRYTGVTAEGLATLARFKRLKFVVTNGGLDGAASERLRRDLPGVKIEDQPYTRTETYEHMEARWDADRPR